MSTNPSARYTLCKDERLHHQKRIDLLFQEGKSFIAYPLRVVYIAKETKDPNSEPKLCPEISILVSVSKKKFKRAVKRNRVKRLIREAYRLNKYNVNNELPASCNSIDIAFIYLKDELPQYTEIEKAIIKTFSILADKLKPNQDCEEANT